MKNPFAKNASSLLTQAKSVFVKARDGYSAASKAAKTEVNKADAVFAIDQETFKRAQTAHTDTLAAANAVDAEATKAIAKINDFLDEK